MKILVVAPHPDDEILGCGGIIAKHVNENDDVYICIVTKGISELYDENSIQALRKEAKNAHEYLKIKETIYLDFPAPKLDNYDSYKIANAIKEILNEKRIDILYLPHRGDIHKDHRIVYEAGIVAARPINSTVKTIMAYETLSETEWAPPFGDDAFIPTVFIDIEKYLEDKIRAFKYYKSQLRNFPNPRSIEGIATLAKFRGATIGLKAAEAFMVVRNIIK